MKKYTRGEEVEIVGTEKGFEGSFFEAVVVSQLVGNGSGSGSGDGGDRYIVQYRTLQTTDDDDNNKYRGPLREFRSQHEIRPLPPQLGFSNHFSVNDKVDAYYNDGWWIGKINAIKGSMYFVYFDYTDELIGFSVDDLRLHQEWVHHDHWEISRKRGRPKKNKGHSRTERQEASDGY